MKTKQPERENMDWACEKCRNGVWIDMGKQVGCYSNHKGKDDGGECVCKCHIKQTKQPEGIVEELNKLSNECYERDSGDGFGRASDEDIEHIADYISKALQSQADKTREEAYQEIVKELKVLNRFTLAYTRVDDVSEHIEVLVEHFNKLKNK